jgi:hypothetical protein
MGLLTELDAFFTDRRDCGDLDAGVDCRSAPTALSSVQFLCLGTKRRGRCLHNLDE